MINDDNKININDSKLSKDEREAKQALNLETLSKYNQLLSILITDVNKEAGLRLLLMSHAIVVNKHIQKLSTTYPEDSIYELYKALTNLKLGIRAAKDSTLRELLEENLRQLKLFFLRVQNYLKPRLPHLYAIVSSELAYSNEELPLHVRITNPYSAYTNTTKMVKEIVKSKNDVKAETSDNMKTIALALRESYGNDNKDPIYSSALDELFIQGYKNLQERKEWEKQFPTQFSEQQKTRKDRSKSVNEKLNLIADALLSEQKKKEQEQ